ncbi:MAG: LppX_LprAFG lipoprotein [Acidimicrobiia bacterium]|nr:LppX_LprAFG lipoprotein [Acidimicrobiia bacterium]
MKRTILLLAAALVLAACGGTAAPTDPVDVDALISRAAAAMESLESARFTMVRSGAPVEVAGLEFASAEGQYAAPDSARAILQVRAADIAVEVGTIAVGDRVWLTNPLTGGWEEIAAGSGFNIAVIFDAEVGWVPLLTDDLSGITYVGIRSDGDGDRHMIHGTIAASRIEFLTAGLVEAQAVEADIWIHPESGHITKVEFETTLDGAVSRWVIGLSEFDLPVTIDAPAGA